MQATQPAIFNGLAQEAVSLCHASLLNAADALGAKSAIDGQVFLVRHLLILRDIARNVELAQKVEPRTGGADAYSMTGGYILVLVYANHLGRSDGSSSQTPYLPCYRAHRRSSPARSSHPSPASTQNTSRTQSACVSPISFHSPLCTHPTSIIGHRPRPKARLRDRHLDRIRTALRTPARIHRRPSFSRRSCRARRRVPHRQSGSHTAVRPEWLHRQRARPACARTRRGCVLGLSSRGETGRHKGGCGAEWVVGRTVA